LNCFTEVKQFAEILSQRCWDDDLSDAKVDEVDNEHWDHSKGRNQNLVPPSYIEEIISNAQYDYRLQRKDGGQVRGKLAMREALQESSRLNLAYFKYDISVTSS
jgi:hypothetical protein